MKACKLFYILLLFVALGMVGCGSDNSTVSSSDGNHQHTPDNNGDDDDDGDDDFEGDYKSVATFSEFVDEVLDGNFQRPGQRYGTQHFNNALLKDNKHLSLSYSRYSCSSSSWWIFNTSSCSSSSNVFRTLRNGNELTRSSGFALDATLGSTLGSLKSSLESVVLNPDKVYKCGMCGCYDIGQFAYPQCEMEKVTRFIVIKGDVGYEIDTSLPLVANPVSLYDLDENKAYYHNPMSWSIH